MTGWRDDPYAREDELYGPQPRYRAPARYPTGYDEPYASGEFGDAYEEGAEAAGRRVQVTPFRFAVVAALVGSIVVTAYALFVERTAIQVPILVSGLAVLGVTLGVMAVSGATGSMRAAEEGLSARAFWWALLGGLCAIAAAGALGSAVVFALIWGSAR
jgi:hypothetical protein